MKKKFNPFSGTLDLVGGDVNIPIVMADPSDASNGDAWVLQAPRPLPDVRLKGFFGAMPLVGYEVVYEYFFTVQTPDGPKRIQLA